jgi:hypothetical protein
VAVKKKGNVEGKAKNLSLKGKPVRMVNENVVTVVQKEIVEIVEIVEIGVAAEAKNGVAQLNGSEAHRQKNENV